MVNLELYRVFYTVAKCGSLTKAAEELYISQPAVSQSIKQLESQLGISLFNRTHRGMELSAQGGKVIFHKIEQALSLFGEAETMISQINTSATGTIRIGASDTIFVSGKNRGISREIPCCQNRAFDGIFPQDDRGRQE